MCSRPAALGFFAACSSSPDTCRPCDPCVPGPGCSRAPRSEGRWPCSLHPPGASERAQAGGDRAQVLAGPLSRWRALRGAASRASGHAPAAATPPPPPYTPPVTTPPVPCPPTRPRPRRRDPAPMRVSGARAVQEVGRGGAQAVPCGQPRLGPGPRVTARAAVGESRRVPGGRRPGRKQLRRPQHRCERTRT